VARLGRQRPLQAIFVRTAQQVVIRAQTGPSAAGVAAQATAVKVAKVSGTCAAGLAASSTAKKVASTTGAAAAGAASQAVVTSVVIQYLVEPFVFAKAASDRAVQAYRYQPPFSYLDFGAPALVFAEAQDGTAPAGASAHGTAKKVAAVTGRSTVGAAATSTIRKVAVTTAAAAAGSAVTAVAAKRAPESGAAQAGLAARATVGSATSRPVTGTCAAGGQASATARKVAQSGGLAAGVPPVGRARSTDERSGPSPVSRT
jgi:hypothetical protein